MVPVDPGPQYTFEDICAMLAKRGVTDPEKVKKMWWRWAMDVILRRNNQDGGIDPTGKSEVVEMKAERDTDWLALKRGIPREQWAAYKGLMAKRAAIASERHKRK